MQKSNKPIEIDPRFVVVADAFDDDPQVVHGGGTGFGSGALKVNGKIFSMMTSRGEFVVKLPKERVDELVEGGHGERFTAGQSRQMKEWLTVTSEQIPWIDLAREARRFVGGHAEA